MKKFFVLVTALLSAFSQSTANASSTDQFFITQRIENQFCMLNKDAQAIVLELKPWKEEIRKKIEINPKYASVLEELARGLGQDESVLIVLTFDSKKNIDLKSTRKCRNPELKTKVLKLVSSSLPFSEPPNDLPLKTGMYIEFFKMDGKIHCNLQHICKVGMF